MAGVRSAEEFCRALLAQGDLASKLRPPRAALPDPRIPPHQGHRPLLPFSDGARADQDLTWARSLRQPGRDARLAVGRDDDDAAGPAKDRLPSLDQLSQPAARIACLSRFAHHELQAIELFAWAILRFPTLPAALRRGFLLVMEEEQAHLQLYLDRLAAHGATLSGGGSDYLWRHAAAIDAAVDPVLAFLSAVGLTFEQANLDFAGLYRDAFLAAGDTETAAVLDRVHHDEIRHVRLAVRWLSRLKAPEETPLAAYLRTVPFPLSPARAKGRRFDLRARRQAGLDDAFIQHVAQAQPYRRSPAGPRAAADSVWLLPNLGAEEDDGPLPKGARGFLRGLHGAWASLLPADCQPWLLPPGDMPALQAWQQALPVSSSLAALPPLASLAHAARGQLVAWLNTRGAERSAAELRLPLFGPSPQIVQPVHDKAFAQVQAQALGLLPDCLRGLIHTLPANTCRDAEAALHHLQQQVTTLPAWLVRAPGQGIEFVLKPALSTSGRGRVHGHVRDGVLQALGGGAGATALFADLARRGGAVIEPWLSRLSDHSVQLAILPLPGAPGSADGAQVQILGTTTQVLSPSGQIRGNRGLVTCDDQIVLSALPAPPDVTEGAAPPWTLPAWEPSLRAAALRLGQAAAQRGYFGIAGIDAFVFVGPDGRPVLRPVVELNARFTTGTVALGLVRRAQQAGLAPPLPFAWAFLLKTPPPPALARASGRVRCISPLPRGPALLLAPTPGDLDPLCDGLDLPR